MVPASKRNLPGPAMRRLLLPALLAPALLAALPATAQMMAPPLVMDTVMLRLSAEGWVETASARVRITVAAALQGSEADDVRAEILAVLATLSPDADWRFLRFSQSRDSAGLDQWAAEMEARLPQEALGTLADKTDAASRPGLRLTVAEVDFTPTTTEVEQVRATLRAEIYARAGEELQRLEAAFPDRDFRVATIDFTGYDYVAPLSSERAAVAQMLGGNAMADPGQGMPVAQHLEIAAQIALQAIAPTGAPTGQE